MPEDNVLSCDQCHRDVLDEAALSCEDCNLQFCSQECFEEHLDWCQVDDE